MKDYRAYAPHKWLSYCRKKLNRKLERKGLPLVSAENPRIVPRTVIVPPRRLQVAPLGPSPLRFLAFSAPVPRLLKEIETNLGSYWTLTRDRRR